MRKINLIDMHGSATHKGRHFSEHAPKGCHRRCGFNGVGYYFYIHKNGDIHPVERIGAHAKGYKRK